MTRPPYRSLCAILGLAFALAAWLPARGEPAAQLGVNEVKPKAPTKGDGADKGKDVDEDKAKEDDKVDGKDKDGDKDADENEEPVTGTTVDRLNAFYEDKETIGDFRRTDVHQYDQEGDDASVGYSLFQVQNGRVPWVVFTAYFYPARTDSLEADVKVAIRDVTSQHKKAEVGEPDVIEVTRHGKKHEGRRVRFKFSHRFGGKDQALASELYLFPGAAEGRLVKYRITFPAADAEELQKKVDEFAESFPWPKGL